MNITLKLEVGVETGMLVSALEDKAALMDEVGPQGVVYAETARRLAKEIEQKVEIRSYGTLS